MGDLPTNWLGDELRSAPSDYAMAFTRDGWNGQHSPLTGDDAALLRTKLAERYRNWTGRDLAIDLLDPNPHTPASGALKIEEADRDA